MCACRDLCDALSWLVAALLLGPAAGSTSRAQDAAAPTPPLVLEAAPATAADPAMPGVATLAPAAAPGTPLLAPEQQVVRFHGPPGLNVEVLGPQQPALNFEPLDGLATMVLDLGVPYRLRLTNIANRPDAALYPVVQLVGHLHRPEGVDPNRHPIRIEFRESDLLEVASGGRMLTQVVYLEDPEQAVPLSLPPSEVPMVTLNPAENPYRVAAALGRIVAVVSLGARIPTAEEIQGGGGVDLPPGGDCPALMPTGDPCRLPCSPLVPCPSPPPPRALPKDEYLCDGGDQGVPAHPSFGGRVGGVDPRDAVVGFHDDRKPRVLPTNRVCIYAPRFAAVQIVLGVNESKHVEILQGAEQANRQITILTRQTPQRLNRNQMAEIGRQRMRPSGLIQRLGPVTHDEIRVLDGLDLVTHAAGVVRPESVEVREILTRLHQFEKDLRPLGIKLAEGLVVTGVAEGAGEKVMAWKPQELMAVEEPPNRPGMFVLKQVDATEAHPGDEVTYTITYRNMGNVPITSVSIVDSLLPRLEYVPRSAEGPAGAVFTARENRVGSMELQWDVGSVPPGATGAVRFRAKVR